MFRLVYNLLWPIGLLVFLPRYLVKMFRRGGYREKFGQRLGFYEADVRRRLAKQNPTWVHAVSVGEVAVALKLIKQLRDLEPTRLIVLTTTTTTGFAFAGKSAGAGVEVMYMPLDFWPTMRRGFGVIQPFRIVLVEAEVWPNLVALAKRRGVPIALINARLSPRSEKRFVRFRLFVRPIFRQLKLISVPDPEDVARWASLGVEQEKIHVLGSVKYDADAGSGLATAAGSESRSADFSVADKRSSWFAPEAPVLLGGSTHQGEEEILAEVFGKLRKQFPSLCLFLAPRHVERVREVRKRLEGRGLAVHFVSESTTDRAGSNCILLDKTGELQNWYQLATVAFVGKSLSAHGGQNPVEPIIAGVPVIFGPNMENFSNLARELVAKKGAIEVRDKAELEKTVAQLLADPATRQSLVTNAEQVLARHRGATERTTRLITGLSPAR